MNKYFNVGVNLIEDNINKIKEQLLKYTYDKNAQYILENIKIDSDFFIALNKEYKKGINFKEFVSNEKLDKSILDIFKFDLYKHQENAIKSIKKYKNTVISTGTGSGKTESFIIPIVDYCLKNKNQKGVKAIIVYPMNALANDQKRRINEILSKTNLKFAIFTGETPKRDNEKNYNLEYENQIYYREDIIKELPDILITNYVMLDRILTNKENSQLIKNSKSTLKYIVIDEIHTYRGNKGAHLKFLLDRLRYSVENKLVHIGCSATLSQNNKSKSTKGYLKGNNLDKFICPLFDCKEYELIQADYKEMENIPNNIKNYDELNIIRKSLFNGSKNIEELKNILKENGFYLQRQDLYDLLNKNSEIIPFRVYLFLIDVQDGIKKCIKCGKYHVGFSNTCLSCGNLLFYVDSDNPNMMIGKIKNKSLTNNIKPYMNGKKESTFVGIFNDNYQDDDSDLVINISNQLSYIDENEIEIYPSKDGEIHLVYLEKSPNIFEIEQKQNFFDLAQSILRNTPLDNRKILSFKDNRQEVSRYKNLSNDIFTSNTFLELSKYIIGNNKVYLKEAKRQILKEINIFIENNTDEEKLKDIIQDFEIWFNRTLRDKSKSISVNAVGIENLNQKEQIIIEFFIHERLIDIKPIRQFNTKYINYNLFPLKKYNVAGLDENAIDDGLFSKVSLSKKGRNIKSFLDSKGIDYDSIDIENVIKSLTEKEYLKKMYTNDKKEVYCLNKEKLYILFEKSNYNIIKDILEDNLFIASAHSSEINKSEKAEIEQKFQNNKLNLLFCTSTLEMGIDIGGLNIVFMQGIPPLPSNFAQRAGRAGRKEDKDALIITLCSDINYHDMYYFENPKDMIDGVIEAPRFQDNNFEIAKKHINALIYQISNFNDKKDIIIQCQKAFPSIDKGIIASYVEHKDFNYTLTNSINKLYKDNTFPDYLFKKDQVKVYSTEAIGKKDKQDYEISSSDLEMACREYVPGEIKYIGGEIVKIIDEENSYKVVKTILGEAKQYKEIYVENAKGSISKQDSNKSHKINTLINFSENKESKCMKSKNKENIIQFLYYPNIELQFINTLENKEKIINEYDKLIAQILNRQAILIKYETEIISYENIVSFVALLNNSIKDLYGLDDDEIRIVYDETKEIFVLYDSNGNKNIDMRNIYLNLDKVIGYGYKKVKNCDCDEINGCYICMKSYSLNKYSALLNKINAYKMAGYLIDKNRLPVAIQINDEYDGIYDLEIRINRSDNNIEFKYDDKIQKENTDNKNQNEVIFGGLIKILKDLDEEIEYIKISSKIDYLIKAINYENDIRNANGNFSRYNFISLKYKNIYGEKI